MKKHNSLITSAVLLTVFVVGLALIDELIGKAMVCTSVIVAVVEMASSILSATEE